MADQILSAVAPNIFERCVGAAGEHVGYIWNYKSNMAKLESQVNKLDEERADKTHAITVAQNNAQKIREGVKSWQGKAHKISEEATQILKDHQDKGKKRCLMGLCPNLVSRYQFSKRACKEQTEIEEAMTETQRIREVSDPPVGQENTILSTEGCFTFDSRKSLLEDIIKALQDETNNLVGLYGLGGMGKTTLAKQVASQAKTEAMFEEVVMASVTMNAVMKEIQGQIASMLGLKLDESTIAERAGRIHERLKGKKVLVILDDLWKKLDLKDVGIPFGAEHMGCKILLTSRFQPVLVSMGTKKECSLVALNEEEAWKLFEEKATDVVKNPAFLTVGKKVAKRCGGVPVLIVTVAASLSRRPLLSAWNDALKQLKKMNNKEMHDIVNSAIESISYNHLDKTHKRLFVLCGVIGGDASVEQVLQYGMGWGLFDDEVVTIQGARERLHSLVLDLKDYCLLLDDHRRNSIKMHDVVRDIAISIGKRDSNMFSIGDDDAQLNTWPMDDVQRCTSIVVHGSPSLSCLPQQLECPQLEMCIIIKGRPFSRNSSLAIPNTILGKKGKFKVSGLGFSALPSSLSFLENLPNTFFGKTGKLKVLDMSGLGFSALPSSLSFLENLQALRLHDCHNLKDISGVGKLKKLQTLSFVGSNIEELPSGIGKLSELRLLEVRHCSKLKVIPAGLIKGLSRLEELYVSHSSVRWEVDECISGCVRNNASLVELKHLPNLCTLEITVKDAKLLPEDLNFEKFERYKITVGVELDCWLCLECFIDPEITRKFRLQVGSTNINHWRHGIKKLIKTTECLYIGEVKGIKNVNPELDENGFPDLKHLCIKKDYEMQYIVNVEDGLHQVAFPSLESLRLSHLLRLQKICNGRLMKESFNNLTILAVENCNELKSLFSSSMAGELRCLEAIRVSSCNALEGIVGESKEDGGVCEKIEFGHLRKLSLINLPKLKNFISYDEILPLSHMSSTSDEKSEEELQNCVSFFEKVSFPKLEQLEIVECERLKCLLTPSVAMALVGLQSLTVQNCARIEHVVAKEEGETNIEMISFPQLTNLCLKNLSGLVTFYAGSKDSNENLDNAMPTFLFPKLAKLELKSLPKMKCFYPREHTTKYPALKEIQVVDCGKVYTMDFLSFPEKQGGQLFEKVISGFKYLSIRNKDMVKILRLYDHSPPHLFQSLEKLTITEFEGESVVFPSKLLSTIHSQLKTLRVINCSFHEVFTYEREVTCHTDDDIFLPQLRTSKLDKLPELKSICKQDQYSPSILNVLDRIEYLSVLKCPRLKRVVSPSVSFRLLRSLTISNCSRLINVIQMSTARSLKRLRTLSIIECEMIEEIIEGEVGDYGEQESSYKIIFSNLEYMGLNKLPRLTTFCSSSDYTFSFPQLTTVSVTECPNMKTFSGGITTTPQLEEVCFERPWKDPTCWENDLNTTVERIYTEMEAKRLATSLPLSNHFEAQAQIHESFVMSEPRMEGQNSTNLGKESENAMESRKGTESCKEVVEGRSKDSDKLVKLVDDIPDKGKGKQLQETPLPEQGVAVSQLVVASSSRSRSNPPTKNPPNQVSQMQVHRLSATVPITSSNYHFKAQAQIHVDDQVMGEGGHEADIHEKGTRKEYEEIVELRNESETWNQSETSPCLVTKGGTIIASSKLCENDIEPRKRTEIGEEEVISTAHEQNIAGSMAPRYEISLSLATQVEAKRLGATLPPTSSSNHFEGEAQTHVNSARMESWDARNQEENVADICEKGKGKELGVSEDCDKYEKTPRYCSNCTGPEQTVAAYLASSQHVVASSPQLIPQNNNHRDDASSSLATQVESERLAIIPSISSTNHFEAQAQAHENEAEYGTEHTVEDHNKKEEVVDTCEKGKEKEVEVSLHGMEHVDKSKDTSRPSDPTFSNYAAPEQTVVASSSQLSPPINSLSDGVRASSLATQMEMVSATSSNNQFEAEAQFHDKSPKKSTDEPRKEGQICRNGIEELRREVGTSSDASDSQQKDFEELHVVKDFTPWLSEFLQILQTQPPVDGISAEQVQLMEHAMEWFGPYLEKSRECLERNKAISELKLEMAEMEVRMQALKEKQKALEDENKATACSVLRFR